MRVGLVTCETLPEPDPDQAPLIDALRAAGMDARMLPWDDGRSSPSDFDLCVLRSSWNYYRDPDAFLSWIRAADRDSRLVNPADLVAWNLHKGYLRELEAGGVPVVPTAWVAKGETASLASLFDERCWDAVVVKPAVSASSFRTRRFDRESADEGQAFLDELASDRDAMVQRYLPSVHSLGERALVQIDGELSHSVRKAPRFAGGEERIEDPRELDDEERAFALGVLGRIRHPMLYGRVDVMRDEEGRMLLSELELVEPSLFLVEWPAALERLVAAIGRMGREGIPAKPASRE